MFDIKGSDVPLGLTLTRRVEMYHDEMLASGEDGSGHAGGRRSIHEIAGGATDEMKALVMSDDRPRASLVDRFLSAGAGVRDLAAGRPVEQGDFFAGRYEVKAVESPSPSGDGPARVVLVRAGRVSGRPVTLTKSIEVQGESLKVDWTIEGEVPPGALFAIEWNLALVESTGRLRATAGGSPSGEARLDQTIEMEPVDRLQLDDDHLGVTLRMDLLPSAAVWHYPVRTVSRSEKGYEAIYQGSALLIVWGGQAPVPGRLAIALESKDRATPIAV